MKETQNMKEDGYLGFRLENNTYYLVDFKENEVLDAMDEVAFLFYVLKRQDDTQKVLLKWGHPDKVRADARKKRKAYTSVGMADAAMDLVVIQGKFPIEEIDKMLSRSGYMATLDHIIEIGERKRNER